MPYILSFVYLLLEFSCNLIATYFYSITNRFGFCMKATRLVYFEDIVLHDYPVWFNHIK